MTARVEYGGRTFDESTDFVAEVRDAVTGYGPSWLRTDLPHAWAVTDWGEAVKAASSVLAARLAEATMTVIETGTREQAEIASVLPFLDATDGVRRALDVFERDPDRFGREPRAHAMVLWKVLLVAPKEPRALDIVRRECAKSDSDELWATMRKRYLDAA